MSIFDNMRQLQQEIDAAGLGPRDLAAENARLRARIAEQEDALHRARAEIDGHIREKAALRRQVEIADQTLCGLVWAYTADGERYEVNPDARWGQYCIEQAKEALQQMAEAGEAEDTHD